MTFDTLLLITWVCLALLFVSRLFCHPGAQEYLPVVPSYLPYIGTGIQYARNPSGFLGRCLQEYGPAFKMLIGGRQLIVVSSADGIAAMLRDPHKVFRSDAMQIDVLKAITGLQENLSGLHEVLHHQIYPVLGRTMAKTAIRQFTPAYVERLLQEMSTFVARSESRTKTLSLKELVGRCQLAATCHVFFGSSFSDDLYDDISCLDDSVYARLYSLPFYWRPSTQARKRLITRLSAYITQAEAGSVEGDLMTHVIDIFKAGELTMEEKAGLLLVFLWGAYANTANTTFWTLAQILADEKLATRLYAEVDNALHAHVATSKGDAPCTINLPALLYADSHAIDGPNLPLLDSVVQEMIRLRQTSTPLRQAICDTELAVDAAAGRRIVVRKGEYLMAHVMGIHWDERWYERSKEFVADRYVNGSNYSVRSKRTTLPFFGWGSGRDICRGRHFATYEVKVFAALCVHYFRIARADTNSTDPWPLRAHKHSIGIQHAERDVMVYL